MPVDTGTIDQRAEASGAGDPYREALRREQRGATLWWLPQGATRWAKGLGNMGPVMVFFLESAWFPLLLLLASLLVVAAILKGAGMEMPFMFWLCYLASITYISRYSLPEALVSAAILIVFAFVLYGTGLSGFRPTLYFVSTMVFLGTALGASHASLFRRVAEQSVTLQRLVNQEGRDPGMSGSDRSQQIAIAARRTTKGVPAKAESGRTSRVSPAESIIVAQLASFASSTEEDQALISFQALLNTCLGISAGQLWSVSGGGQALELIHNLGAPSIDVGAVLDISGDDFLMWLMTERRVVMFEDSERTALERQFPQTLPSPLLPLVSMGHTENVQMLLRVTSANRPTYTTEDRRLMALLVSVAESVFQRTGTFKG